MLALQGSALRWAVGDGPITLQDGSSIDEESVLELCEDIGTYEIDMDGAAFTLERVGSRYCSVDDVRLYGERNNDAFDRFDDDQIADAIQQAEEIIDSACSRRFCRSSINAWVRDGMTELPVQDVVSVEGATVVNGRQCYSDHEHDAVIVYGAKPSARLRAAAVKLAASIIRPRVGAENARGTSMDGVFISFTLPDGTDGSWTGIPDVDAFIELNRSKRKLVG